MFIFKLLYYSMHRIYDSHRQNVRIAARLYVSVPQRV